MRPRRAGNIGDGYKRWTNPDYAIWRSEWNSPSQLCDCGRQRGSTLASEEPRLREIPITCECQAAGAVVPTQQPSVSAPVTSRYDGVQILA